MIPLRRLALAFLLCLALVAGASALDGYAHSQTVEYAACDQAVYQQDVVIHRSAGTAYEETGGGLNIWHLYVGTDCQADYDDLRFTVGAVPATGGTRRPPARAAENRTIDNL